MKLYTEEQMRRLCEISYLCGLKGNASSYEYLIENSTPVELPSDEVIAMESENYALKTHPNPKMITFRKYCADDFKQGVKYVLNKIQGGTI